MARRPARGGAAAALTTSHAAAPLSVTSGTWAATQARAVDERRRTITQVRNSRAAECEIADPMMLDGPVLGWTAGGVTADGVVDVAGTSDWRGRTCSAEPCPAAERRPEALSGTGSGIAAADHTPPAPFCECGLAVYPRAPKGRWRDRYRDRLGHRMQTAALVITWGRVILERDRVRGEHGRVLALLLAPDEPPRRRERIETAAQRLGAEVVELRDEETPDFDALASRLGGEHAERLTAARTAATLRRRDVRRWQTTSRLRLNAALIELFGIVLVAGLGGLTLQAAGLATAATVLGAAALVVCAWSFRRALLGFVQVEALAPGPAGERSPGMISLAAGNGPAGRRHRPAPVEEDEPPRKRAPDG